MAARAGMADVITTLRGLCEAGTADYALAGATYWSDDQLQDILDDHRTDKAERMTAVARYASGAEAFNDYYFKSKPVEQASSGSAVFHVFDSQGSVAGTADYTVNYRAGHVEFGTDQGEVVWNARVRYFDINGAAAEVWRGKAAHYQASGFDVETDNHNIKRSQLVDRALKMVERFENLSTGAYGPTVLDRTDAY